MNNELRDGRIRIDRDSINKLADKFLDTDPAPGLARYVRKYVRYKYELADWWWAYDFFAGYGAMTKQLSNQLSNGFLWGLGMDVGFRNFVMDFRINLGSSKTRDSIRFNAVTWARNSQAEIFLPEASVGYKMRLGEKLDLVPFAGISSMDIGPSSADIVAKPAYKDVGFRYATTFTAGLYLDGWPGKQHRDRYWHVRLRYAFNAPDFASKYAGINGYYQSITLGIGGYGRRMKRIE